MALAISTKKRLAISTKKRLHSLLFHPLRSESPNIGK